MFVFQMDQRLKNIVLCHVKKTFNQKLHGRTRVDPRKVLGDDFAVMALSAHFVQSGGMYGFIAAQVVMHRGGDVQ